MPSHGREWRKLTAQVRQRQHPCWICKQPINWNAPPRTPNSFSVDHKIPTSLGGTDSLSNLETAHYGHNSARGNMQRGDFPTSRRW